MKSKKITPRQKIRFQEMRDEGATLQEIADRFGVSISAVYTYTVSSTTTSVPTTPRQKNHRRTTEEDRDKMRTLRAAGTGVAEIARLLGFSLSVIHTYTKDVPVPAKPRTRIELKKVSDRQITNIERKQRRATDEEDRQWQANQPLPLETVYVRDEGSWPFHFDYDAQYDTTGPNPDRGLVTHAQSILDQWVSGTAKGRLDERRININMATLIYASSIPLWDYDEFLHNRGLWKATRALSGINSTQLADRLGISPASISRYEKKKRNPPTGLMRNLHDAYTQLLEEALQRAEWNLVLDSHADTLIAQTGIPYDELENTMDDVYQWVAQGTDIADLDIGHIEHLAVVRRWMPYPAWRTPTAANLWLNGYPNAHTLQPA